MYSWDTGTDNPGGLPFGRARGMLRTCDLSRLVFRGIAIVDRRISLHHDLHDTAAARTSHANPPAIGEIADTPPVKGKLVNAMGTREERDTDGASGIHESPGERNREFCSRINGLLADLIERRSLTSNLYKSINHTC